MPHSSLGLIDILRSVLRRLDDQSSGGPADPALRQFKQRILRSIAQLDLERSSLKAPDVLVPESESAPHRSAQTAPDHLKDSVVVLVAPRPRKSRNSSASDSNAGPSNTGGRSSAA